MSEKDILVERGRHVKTRNLIEQASYTIKLARENYPDLTDIGLSEEFLTEFDGLLQEVITLEGKQETAKDDVSLTTSDVNDKVTDAKDWVKKAKLKAKRAFRLNKAVLDNFYTVPVIARSVPNAIAALVKLIELNKKYDAQLSPYAGGNAFAAKGEKILTELQEIDSTQERAKTSLPESSRELYYKQGLLYFKIKDINDMGVEIFLDDPIKRSQYNMTILNRGGAKRKTEQAETTE